MVNMALTISLWNKMVLSGSYKNEDKQLVEEQFWMLWQKLWKWKYLLTEQIFIQNRLHYRKPGLSKHIDGNIK